MRMTNIALTAAVLLAGCSTHPAQPLQEDYGTSVHSLLQNQTASPNAVTSANGVVVEGASPEMVNSAVKALQTDIGKGENIRKPPNESISKELGSQ
jgi:uncharacterized protein YcfL